LVYQGVIAATEFLVYSVNKLYIAYELSTAIVTAAAALPYFIIYDENNTDIFYSSNMIVTFTNVGTPVDFVGNYIEIYNYYFSRLSVVGVSQIKFNGYRITLN
jgi:hypothetical protein